MNIDNLEELKAKFAHFKDLFSEEKVDEATALLEELLQSIEEKVNVCRAANVDNRGNITAIDSKSEDIYISLNHVMEYYLYAYYYKPKVDVKSIEIPVGEYYRNYGDLCCKLGKYKAATAGYKKAIEWNPIDLDAILGMAECYKYLNMNEKYLIATKEAYRLCCTRATMARYYRNMGYYHLTKYNVKIAKACYLYSNIYYETDNALNELDYIKQSVEASGDASLNEYNPTIKEMQQLFDENEIEAGPSSDTIGVVYRVGEIMMEDKEYKLARDCFSICYDITREEQLNVLLSELEKIQ